MEPTPQSVPPGMASGCGTCLSSLRPGMKEKGRWSPESVVIRILHMETQWCEEAVGTVSLAGVVMDVLGLELDLEGRRDQGSK